jgi:hypothetical protein
VVLPPSRQKWVAHRSDDIVRAIADLGVPVIGDLDDLRAPTEQSAGTSAADTGRPDDSEVSAAAVAAIVAMARSRPRRD